MNKQKRKSFFLAVLMLMFSSAVLASAEENFKKGSEFFKQADYSSAVVQFKLAEKQGMRSVALYYNLASSYFKLEDYENSKRYFKAVAKSEKMRDLAEYNLGLIALKEDNSDEADQYFSNIVKHSKDKKIVALSRSQLFDMQKADEAWKAHFFANMGYDDNITALPSDAAADISDSFYNLFVSVDTVIAGERSDGWIADVSYFRTDFSDTDIYDQYQYALGIRREVPLGNWDTSFHLNLTKKTFGDEDFQTVTKLDMIGKKSVSDTGRLYLRYRYEDVGSDNVIYDYLEGSRQRAKIEYRSYTSKNIKQLYYELELNDGGIYPYEGGPDAYEYSPTRHTVRGKYTQILSEQWHLIGDLSYRVSDYPESASFDRNDKQGKLTLSVDYRFDKSLKLKTSLLFMNNESTVDLYDYDKTMMTIGVSKLF